MAKNKIILKCVLTPIFAALVGAVAVGNYFAKIYEDTISEFLYGTSANFEGENVEKALENGDALNQQIEEEGVVMFRNEDMNRKQTGSHEVNKCLPLTSEELKKVNVFGWAATEKGWVAGSDGSCNANGGMNKDKIKGILKAFDNVEIGPNGEKIEYNQELIDMYEDFRIGRAESRGLAGKDQFFMLIEPGIEAYQKTGLGGKTLLENAKDFSDVAVVVISRLGGENNDLPYFQLKNTTGKYTDNDNLPRDNSRTYLDISTEEEDMIRMVRDNFKKVIVVYNGCNNMNLEFVERYDLDACISVNGTGQSGSYAIPKILAGQINPSGKSVQIQPYDLSTDPTFLNCGKRTRSSHQITYVEDIYIGYKWYETADKEGYWNSVSNDFGTGYEGVVQYPFGFGLSYTDFEWKIASVEPEVGSAITADTEFKVVVDVTNIGDVKGKDIVELYYSAPYYNGQIEKSSINLCAFAKTSELEPGSTERVELKFDAYDMASYDCYDKNHNRNYGYELDKGNYQVKLMRDSHHVDSCEGAVMNFVAEKNIKFRNDPVTGNRVENRFTNYTVPVKKEDGSFEQVKINAYANCALDGSDANQTPVRYLTRENFTGTFPTTTLGARTGEKVTNAVNYVPDLSSEVKDFKLEKDSGLRLITRQDGSSFTASELKNGVKNAKFNDELMLKLGADYDDPEWETLLNQMSKNEINSLVTDGNYYNREVESIGKPKLLDSDGPSGLNRHVAGVGGDDKMRWTMYSMPAVIAQSWNTKLSYSFGLSIGAESLSTGNNGWYAPGANTMRSPFDGRNSEYYSEDPILAGYMAAESCRGAINNGMNVYLKHFALNETESGRINLTTWCTEQAFREIYLRPYERAVKVGGADGIMTSLNRIGNIRSTHNKALMTDILRNEWGFRGSVVTDSYQGSDDPRTCVKAGTDLMLGVARTKVIDDDETLYFARRSCKNIIYAWVHSYATSRTHDASEDIITSNVGAFVQGESPTPYWYFGVAALDLVVAAGVGIGCYFIYRKPRTKKNKGETK